MVRKLKYLDAPNFSLPNKTSYSQILVLDFADQIKDSLIDLREESETEKFSFVRNCCPMMVAGI